jgi:hypothetical protein
MPLLESLLPACLCFAVEVELGSSWVQSVFPTSSTALRASAGIEWIYVRVVAGLFECKYLRHHHTKPTHRIIR